jgi:uncharacterized membrane protein
VTASFEGPLPPPQFLEKYEQISPGFTERHLTMVEKQADHRQFIERTVIASKIRHEAIGQIMAFVLALVAFGIGGAAVLMNHTGVGSSIMGIDAGAIIGMFAYRQIRENIRRKEGLPPSLPAHLDP